MNLGVLSTRPRSHSGPRVVRGGTRPARAWAVPERPGEKRKGRSLPQNQPSILLTTQAWKNGDSLPRSLRPALPRARRNRSALLPRLLRLLLLPPPRSVKAEVGSRRKLLPANFFPPSLRSASTRSSVALRLLICLVGGEQHRTGKRQRSDAQLDAPIEGGGSEERPSGSSVKIDAPSCCCGRTPGLTTPHPLVLGKKHSLREGGKGRIRARARHSERPGPPIGRKAGFT